MIDIVFTSLTGIPTKHEGGGNRIIYDILKNISFREFSCKYFSYTCQRTIDKTNNLLDDHNQMSLKKRFGILAFNNIPFYKRVVTTPLYHRFYIKRIKRFFTSRAPLMKTDIIHSHHPVALAYLSGNTSAKRILTIHSKGGFVYETRGKGSDESFYENDLLELSLQEGKAIHLADYVTFPSKAAKDLYFEKNDVDCNDNKVRVIYNGVDLDYISETIPQKSLKQKYRIPDDADIFIFNVADHSKQKNIALLLKVIEIIVHVYKKNPILVNVGKGPDTAELQKIVNGFGIRKNVLFLGAIANKDVIGLMKLCDCFVLTSENVIFDLVVLEALACGTAVFVSDEGGNREVIQTGVNGYLLSKNKENEIAKSILTNNYSRVKENARKSIEKFSVEVMTKSYEALYTELLKQ